MSSESDLQYFIANKAILTENKLSAMKRTGPFAGLRNQGATCYLNSLIQCLFHDAHFVRRVMETTDNPDSVIITELQKLFARLMLSDNQAIDTEPLLSAFGWSKSQMFEQHDIHELFSVLLDALGKDSNYLNTEISKLLQGQLSDVLQCSSCGHTSRNASTFLNFSLDLPDGATRCVLKDLISAHLKPEILDEDNKWQCSGCSEKVRATKAQEYAALPKLMMVHLKRFRYDPATRRRMKLSTPVHFPQSLDANELFSAPADGSKFGQYRLTGVVLHSGTAMGGHYRCYVNTSSAGDNHNTAAGCWVDCNDATITALSAEEVAQMLADPVLSASDAVASKASYVHDNVYMLVYKATDSDASATTLEALKQSVSATVRAEIEAENASFEVRFRLQELRAQLVDLRVNVHFAPEASATTNTKVARETVQLDLLKSATLDAVLQQAHELLTSSNKVDGAAYPITQCRLRKYSKKSQTALGETFGGREGTTLEDLGLTSSVTLAFEVRSSADAEFAEFNPSDMNVTFTVWSADGDAAEAVTHSVLVPGRETSTIGALRAAVAQVLGVDTTRVVLIHNDASSALEILSADDNTLISQQVFPGDSTLVVEVAPEGAVNFTSVAFPALDAARNRAVIYFNNPLQTSNGEAAESDAVPTEVGSKDGTYCHTVEVSLDLTLAAFKAQVAPVLEIADATTFFCKRSAASSAPQLKDESKTLKELAFVNHSVIHLQLGQGCKVGEHMLRVEVDVSSASTALSTTDGAAATNSGESGGIAGASQPSCILLGEVAVSEKMSVLQLKQLLCAQWATLAARGEGDIPVPQSPNHIRLRDGKSGKASGPLRDDRIVGRCLLGLADGRRIVAQVLQNAEFISADDLVISLRVASFDRRILHPAVDLPITRTSTIKALYEKILALVPQLNEPLPADFVETNPSEPEFQEVISIAKGFTSGPALTLKSAFKLKWDDPAVLKSLVDPTPSLPVSAAPMAVPAPAEPDAGDDDAPPLDLPEGAGGVLNNPFGLDRPPLNLRDGSIIVVRGKADFWRAQVAMRARKAEETTDDNAGAKRPTTAGTGAAAARARKTASLKARVAAANAGNTSAGDSGTEEEVLVKGSALPTGASSKRAPTTEKSLKIATSNKDRPPVPAESALDESKLSPTQRQKAEDVLEHSMEDLPPPIVE